MKQKEAQKAPLAIYTELPEVQHKIAQVIKEIQQEKNRYYELKKQSQIKAKEGYKHTENMIKFEKDVRSIKELGNSKYIRFLAYLRYHNL